MFQNAVQVPLGLRKFLLRDHERLGGTFERLLEAFKLGDRDLVRGAWNEFERGLLGHLAAEEKYILPLFRLQHGKEANALLAEHAHIRTRLAELGTGVDLHLVSLPIAEELIASLEHHATREEGLLYAWAEQEIASREAEAVREEVERARP